MQENHTSQLTTLPIHPITSSGTHLTEEDHSSTRAAKAFVSRRGNDIRVLERGWDHASGYEAADVRHVRQQPRSGVVRDLLHTRVVDRPRVCACARDDELFGGSVTG